MVCHYPREKTDVPEYKKNADFIADLFKKFPLGGQKHRGPEAPGSIQAPMTAPCVEPYEEDDNCYMDPPPAVNVSKKGNTYDCYFFNTNSGECQVAWVTKTTLGSQVTRNIFKTVTKCQKSCSKCITYIHHTTPHV